jgi:hypothetical protein
MADQAEFNLAAAHSHFSAHCFNAAWDLMEQPERTTAQDEEMLRLSLASTWHWTQREDCTPANLSVGYWQTSRIYALMGQADNARRYGLMALTTVQDEEASFYQGYAYEALARAEALAGDREKMAEYLEQARRAAERVADGQSREMLEADLDTIHA